MSDMAEIEFTVTARVCLRRRNADADSLVKAVNASVADRDSAPDAINQRFTARDARPRLYRLHPCHSWFDYRLDASGHACGLTGVAPVVLVGRVDPHLFVLGM